MRIAKEKSDQLLEAMFYRTYGKWPTPLEFNQFQRAYRASTAWDRATWTAIKRLRPKEND